MEDYIKVESAKALLLQPFDLTHTDSFDLMIRVMGGALPVRPAPSVTASPALMQYNLDFRPALKKAGFVSMIPAARNERNTARKPRARFQFSKR